MEKHTPGRWVRDNYYWITDTNGEPIAKSDIHGDKDGSGNFTESEANAARIVACVNALEGIPTAALEAGVIKEMVEFIKRTIKEPERIGRLTDLQIHAKALLAKIGGN